MLALLCLVVIGAAPVIGVRWHRNAEEWQKHLRAVSALRRVTSSTERHEELTPASPSPLSLLHDLCAVAHLSDPQLCRLWRMSYVYLQQDRSPAALTRISGLRQVVLDELAARDPDGFARWMDSGARAASDPSRFISRSGG